MRTPFKTLTVGLVLVTAAVAGCSSTTAGSSGAVQNAATASASAAASSAASTGAPAVVQEAAPAEATAGASCADGGVCVVGDSGPGGGVVFYVSKAFACGANMASTCKYLEAAPNPWNPDSKISCKAATGTSCGGNVQETSDFSSTGKGFPWCTGSGKGSSIPGTFSREIGSGYANTTIMLPDCNPGDAGNVARSYTGGGMTDWSLASEYELTALYRYPNRAAIGGFNSGIYWSSTQNGAQTAASYTFDNSMNTGAYFKYSTYGVRPIRAF
jgi:hypothetical protein